MRRGLRWALPIVAAAAIAATAPPVQTASGAVSEDTSVPSSDTGVVEVVEPDPVDPVPEDLATTAGHAAWLVETYPEDFGGTWYDSTRGLVVVQTVSSMGRDLAMELLPLAQIDMEEVQFSASDLEGQIRAIASDGTLADAVDVVSPDYENNSVLVEMPRMTTSDVTDLDASGNADVEVDITDAQDAALLDTRDSDTGPGHAGGMRYTVRKPSGEGGMSCTAGWSFTWAGIDYMLTAGHCYPRHTDYSEAWTTVAGDWYEHFGDWPGYTTVNDSGTDSIKFDDGEYHGDLALITMRPGHNSNPKMWTGTTASSDKLDVTQWSAPYVGQQLCVSAAYTGKTCGFVVTKTNAHYHVPGTPTLDSMESVDIAEHGNDCLAHGDSGGAVYDPITGTNNVRAVGIVSGGNTSGCSEGFMWFTGVEEAGQAWGGGVKTQ